MRSQTWSGIAAVTLALALLSLGGQSQAGPIAEVGCCVCSCAGEVRCLAQVTSNGCREFCAGRNVINSTGCEGRFENSSCAAVPECPPERAAPALGNTGLTVVALVLAALGVFGLRRAAGRKRA